ncbi:MAG TPA: acyloxyacyl hydrolase [Allosphingosinicella sp.]
MNRFPFIVAAGAAFLAASPAHAGELFGGIYAHDVDTPLNKGGYEDGLAVSAGFRGKPIKGLKAVGGPSPYVLVSVSTDGGTNFAAAGLSWKIGKKVYLRPGIGLAVHDRSSNIVYGNLRGDFGSRILFEPELGFGVQVSERVSVEASWIHLSHGGLFNGGQNPGMDNIGLRLNFRL